MVSINFPVEKLLNNLDFNDFIKNCVIKKNLFKYVIKVVIKNLFILIKIKIFVHGI